MPYRDGGRVREKRIPFAGTSEVEPPVEINLHRALNPLSEEVRENLFDKKEQLGLVGKAAPDRRSRTAPVRASFEKITPIPFSQSKQSSSLPSLTPLSSRTVWAVLDFAVAFWCGSLAILAPLLVARTSASTGGFDRYLLSLSGVALFALCVAVLCRFFGLQAFDNSRTFLSEMSLILLSVLAAGFGIYGVLRLFTHSALTGLVIPLEMVLTWAALFSCRMLWRRYRDIRYHRNAAVKNILIAGADPTGRKVRDCLLSQYPTSKCFKGFVELDGASDGVSVAERKEIVGSVDDVISLAKSMYVDEIIFTRRPTTPNILSNVLSQARLVGVGVRLMPDVSEGLKDRADVQYLGELPTIVIFERDKHTAAHLMKRSMDVVLGSAAILALFPFCVIIAFLIKLQSPGPVFYQSKRIGFRGMIFNCYKFRTMMENADSMGDQFVPLNERRDSLSGMTEDPRVTEIGSVLRRFSFDELPQLWNVLSGEMSLVGPRPSISSEAVQYKTAHVRTLDMVPGMTGLWQVEGRQNRSFESPASLDNKYAKDWSMWLDLKIIARALNAALRGSGA
jgi:exopolysaccharide biosynthesis polyprenyl glycosylphosphotransferase